MCIRDRFEGIDLLDPTKLVPEELVPVTIVGTLTLDRNPDNFFAETEQVAFCTTHVPVSYTHLDVYKRQRRRGAQRRSG